MNTITVAQLRQNPTPMLDAVERGETYRITKHGREVGIVSPPQYRMELIPARKPGPMRLSDIPKAELTSADTIDELLEWNKGDH